jgi:hypothetical protein
MFVICVYCISTGRQTVKSASRISPILDHTGCNYWIPLFEIAEHGFEQIRNLREYVHKNGSYGFVFGPTCNLILQKGKQLANSDKSAICLRLLEQ